MKTHLSKIPDISLKRASMTAIPNSRSSLARLSNLASSASSYSRKRLGDLYTSAGYIFYTADQRRIDEAKRKHGDNYLIKLFPQNPRLVLQEFETISQDRFREIYNDFVAKYEKDLPNMRKTIKDLRERAMEIRRYGKYLERESGASRKKFTDMIQERSEELNKLTDDFVTDVEAVRNRSMASLVYKRGTRKNGSPLARLRGPLGNLTLKSIQSYLK